MQVGIFPHIVGPRDCDNYPSLSLIAQYLAVRMNDSLPPLSSNHTVRTLPKEWRSSKSIGCHQKPFPNKCGPSRRRFMGGRQRRRLGRIWLKVPQLTMLALD